LPGGPAEPAGLPALPNVSEWIQELEAIKAGHKLFSSLAKPLAKSDSWLLDKFRKQVRQIL
jgi:hypothetical protein